MLPCLDGTAAELEVTVGKSGTAETRAVATAEAVATRDAVALSPFRRVLQRNWPKLNGVAAREMRPVEGVAYRMRGAKEGPKAGASGLNPAAASASLSALEGGAVQTLCRRGRLWPAKRGWRVGRGRRRRVLSLSTRH